MGRPVAAVAAALLAAGCATQSVLLLPDENGGQGAVAVLESGGRPQTLVVDRGNRRARIGRARVSEHGIDPARIPVPERTLLAELPSPARTFVLYYDEGTTRIVASSRPELDALLAEVARRPGVEVQTSGHTDRKGSEDDNDRLSQERAESVLEQLVSEGIPRDRITAVGRGERDPRVPTADGVDEVANRRVEVIVR